MLIDYKKYNLPNLPGCYIYRNNLGKIIYIGKAKNLKKRVSSYFSKKHDNRKTNNLVKHIKKIDYIVTQNELESWILESRLIKEYKPKYNIELKHGTKYAYIKISNDKYPRLSVARTTSKTDGTYFGPFVSSTQRNTLIELSKKYFGLRSCKKLPSKSCILFETKMCSAPCINLISESDYNKKVSLVKELLSGKISNLLDYAKLEMNKSSSNLNFEKASFYRNLIDSIVKLDDKQIVDTDTNYNQDIFSLVHNGAEVVIEVFNIKKGVLLKSNYFKFSFDNVQSEDFFEEFIKSYYECYSIPEELILDTSYLNYASININLNKNLLLLYLKHIKTIKQNSTKFSITIPKLGLKKNLVDLCQKNALQNLTNSNQVLDILKEKLKLPKIPLVMECFDISNLGDEHIVASMVQFLNGKPNTKNYRKYKMKTVTTQNDFDSMREVIYRRYYHLKNENLRLPDLIVIDGGKQQLNVAVEQLEKLSLTIPIISLAKREEEVYVPGKVRPYRLSKKSPELHVLIHIRNESHRFAVSYNRTLRFKKLKSDISNKDKIIS